jgi:hypothetical protein
MCIVDTASDADDPFSRAAGPALTTADVSFTSAAQALRMASAALDYLNAAAGNTPAGKTLAGKTLAGGGPSAAGLDGAACGAVLIALGEIQAKLTAAHAGFLRRFDAADAHDADGYGTSSSWLAAKTGMTRRDAKAAVRQMRQLRDRPLLDGALAAGDITDSLAFEIAGWTRKLPAAMREETDKILLQAYASGASSADLAIIAACAIEQWRQQQPDPDSPDDGFDDRFVQAGTTFGGAGVIRGNLTPECATAVRAVLQALGKKAGQEDDRTEGKRFHDALQLAWAPQPRAGDLSTLQGSPRRRLRRRFRVPARPWSQEVVRSPVRPAPPARRKPPRRRCRDDSACCAPSGQRPHSARAAL